jgi:hypothetical protein
LGGSGFFDRFRGWGMNRHTNVPVRPTIASAVSGRIPNGLLPECEFARLNPFVLTSGGWFLGE